MIEYGEFLSRKRLTVPPSGFDPRGKINPALFDWQRDIVRWGIRKGKAALFEDCGLGKTGQQLTWADHISSHTGMPVLDVAPLAVASQTKGEGDKFGIPVRVCRSQDDVRAGVNVTNYEMLEHFAPQVFGGIVLDESSILKGDGPMRKRVTEFAARIPYRLACTATPAPNDHMELGNHAEFLGIMSKTEMLSTFFVHDGGDTSKWRLKGHAEDAFWRWVASWAVMIRKPSDLGYADGAFELPPLTYHQHTVGAEWSAEFLFPVEAKTMTERRNARRDSLESRVKLAADLVNESPEQWICWCNLNAESEQLTDAIPTAIQVTGSDKQEHKETAPLRFIAGEFKDLVSKPDILGWGMNFQHCHKALACGLSDSWESLYQIVRRIWRFGQKMPVDFHVITGELEGAVVRNIERKEKQSAQMAASMLGHMREINTAEIRGTIRESESYKPQREMVAPAWL